MSYYVYMLKSIGVNPVTYVGYTANLKKESVNTILVKEQNLLEVVNGS